MNKIVQLMISALIFIPLIFWSFTPNPFATPKELGIAIVGIVSLLSLAYQATKTKNLSSLSLSTSLPLILFVISIIGTLFANPEGRPEALQSKGLTLILLPMLAYIIATYKSNHLVSFSQKLLVGIGTFFSIHSLLSLVFLSKSPYLPTIMQNISFTFTGSYPTTLTIILLSFVLLASYLKNLNKKQRPWSYLILSLHIIAITAIIALMFPGGALSPNNLSFSASWSIALDALKSMRSLFFGIGLSNYSLLYTSVKPLFVNTTTLWNTLPATSVNEILTLLPTAGVLATISLFYLILHLLIKTFKTPLFLPSLVIILSLFAFPASSSIYLLFFLFYGLSDHRESTVKHVSPLQAYLTGIVCVVVAVAIAFISSRTVLSERYITLAQQKLASTNTQEAYQYHIKAIQTSPKITNYHLSFADVNFKLAAALSQKENLTDTDRETITRLVKQSVESGKAAITLRPNDPRTWLTVAKIYQNLINVADNAETFALESYAKAIALDRANPSLRLEYASLLTQIADSKKTTTESAILNNRAASEIQTAIQLKPDFSNAYYNLGTLYKKANNNSAAQKAFEAALQYLPSDSQEYAQIKNELANLGSANFSTPTPLPSPVSSADPE